MNNQHTVECRINFGVFNMTHSHIHFYSFEMCVFARVLFIFHSRWFCHFDDDNYVNIPKLVELLSNYSPTLDWYLGKPSIASPLEIYVDNVSRPKKRIHVWYRVSYEIEQFQMNKQIKSTKFWFASDDLSVSDFFIFHAEWRKANT